MLAVYAFEYIAQGCGGKARPQVCGGEGGVEGRVGCRGGWGVGGGVRQNLM